MVSVQRPAIPSVLERVINAKARGPSLLSEMAPLVAPGREAGGSFHLDEYPALARGENVLRKQRASDATRRRRLFASH